MKKITLLLLLCSAFTFAQLNVSGTIFDSEGSPLPGANIQEKGTSNGSTTDFDGNYSINASTTGTLVISFVGYSTKEESIDGRSKINITLSEGYATFYHTSGTLLSNIFLKI